MRFIVAECNDEYKHEYNTWRLNDAFSEVCRIYWQLFSPEK